MRTFSSKKMRGSRHPLKRLKLCEITGQWRPSRRQPELPLLPPSDSILTLSALRWTRAGTRPSQLMLIIVSLASTSHAPAARIPRRWLQLRVAHLARTALCKHRIRSRQGSAWMARDTTRSSTPRDRRTLCSMALNVRAVVTVKRALCTGIPISLCSTKTRWSSCCPKGVRQQTVTLSMPATMMTCLDGATSGSSKAMRS
mmetsp:Transcript_67238/g.161144  ORF Transcript_67238/g.161144 Transcript_67238/m.161144 type:complete len:200 (+) Transcript_67238:1261-1860(+)